MRVLVVGGVAGGASTAARLRRLDEKAEIVLFERGPYVSFANCGLPYYVGNVITEEKSLLLATRELFRERMAIDVRTEHEVLSIDRKRRMLLVCDLKSGKRHEEPWDKLVLAPGAQPVRPSVAGVDLPGVFVLRTIPDSRRIKSWLDDQKCTKAVVIGAGFIGLEMAENLVQRGLSVTIVEKAPQVMPPLDPEMASLVKEALLEHGLSLRLGEGLEGIRKDGNQLVVATDAGHDLATDVVILALGVRPESGLAHDAELTLGGRGGIVVDDQMHSSDPDIFAVGDAIEVHDLVSQQEILLPLAGPANRQGRIAAGAIAGRPDRFRGVQGTAIVGLFSRSIAVTGASEKSLKRAGISGFRSIYLHPGHHAGYYPGAHPLHLKLTFALDGKILGAQAVGQEGVDKRIDVIATMIQLGGTVHDLAAAELCYAPQFGAAKDPINLAGMIAQNVLSGDMPIGDWSSALSPEHVLVDVREDHEFESDHIPGALNFPLSKLRANYSTLPEGKPLWIYCAAGQRAYYAQRFLMQQGYTALSLSGGFTTWRSFLKATNTERNHAQPPPSRT